MSSTLDNDFLDRSNKIKILGEGAFGTVSLYDTPKGIYVIKETKIEKKSPGYPPDFLIETDLLLKFRDHPHIVKIEGVFFDLEEKKGYLVLEPLDCNLLKWARETSFEQRIKCLPDLIISIGGVLSLLKYFSFIHNDIKTNNILVKSTSSATIFKLADFGKSHKVKNVNGLYGGIGKYRSPVEKDLYSAEYWAFMVVLVEVIIGGRKMIQTLSPHEFYAKYNKSKTFHIEKYLRSVISNDEFEKIPPIFWNFVRPTLHFKKSADIMKTLDDLGYSLSYRLVTNIRDNLPKSFPMQTKIKKAADHIIMRLTTLNLSKYIEDVIKVFNRFVFLMGHSLYDFDLLHYAEVALVTVTFGKVSSYRYFQEQNEFLLFQRFFMTKLGYQIIM